MDPQLDQLNRYLEEQEMPQDDDTKFLRLRLDTYNRVHYYQQTFDIRAWTAPGPWRPWK